MKRNVRKMTLVCIFSLVFVLNTNLGLALSENCFVNDEIQALLQIKQSVDLKGIVSNIEQIGDKFVAKMECENIEIPMSARDIATLSVGEETIGVSLPKEIGNAYGKQALDGTIIFKGDSGVDSAVQAVEEEISEDEYRSAIRTMIIINDKNAAKSYEFEYELPQGCRFIMGDELGSDTIPNDGVGIVNEEGYAIAVVDSPWAKDARGNDIFTKYEIMGNKLIQHIYFTDENAFPIIADPMVIVETKEIKAKYKKYTEYFYPSQLSEGYTFHSGGSVGWFQGGGTKHTMSVQASLPIGPKGNLQVTFNVGKISYQVAGSFTAVNFPPSSKAQKVKVKLKLAITEKCINNKYKITKISNNGKTKEVTYKWVTVKNWIEVDGIAHFESKLVSC